MRSSEIEAYKKTLTLSPKQREILVGILLGDGHLETSNKGRTYRLKIEQSERHRTYIAHLYECFRQWVRTAPQEKVARSGDCVSRNWWFQTLSHSAFRFYAHQFYGKGKKSVPDLIHHYLTPRALAYWYMDDGSIKSAESKGVIFNTQGYMPCEVEMLSSVLKNSFDLDAKPRRQKEGYQIYVSGRSFERFLGWIDPFIIPEMRYKLPLTRRTQMPKL